MTSINRTGSIPPGIITEVGSEFPFQVHEQITHGRDLFENGDYAGAAAAYCDAASLCDNDPQRWLVLTRGALDFKYRLYDPPNLQNVDATQLASAARILQRARPELPDSPRNNDLRQAMAERKNSELLQRAAIQQKAEAPSSICRLPPTGVIIDSAPQASYSCLPTPHGRLGSASVARPGAHPTSHIAVEWFGAKSRDGIVALFDGGSAPQAANLAAAHLKPCVAALPDKGNPVAVCQSLKKALVDMGSRLPRGTAATMLVFVEPHIYIVNAGMGHALEVQESGSRQLSTTHHLADPLEAQRWRAAGGPAVERDAAQTTRALGDPRPYVSTTPQITHVPMEFPRQAIILASPGIRRALSKQTEATVVRNTLVKTAGQSLEAFASTHGAEHAALAMVAAAHKRVPQEPMSALVLHFGSDTPRGR